uniref:Nucleosome assembly protein 1-like 1 n=1 Tax=Macrostomum lignano TaxID=282301 RepID=A0A1I8H607_9PLAT
MSGHIEDNSTAQDGENIVDALLNDPSVLAQYQKELPFDSKLQAMANYKQLPEPVKRRVRALKKLQFRSLEIESEFYRELHDLEMRYADRFAEQLNRRQQIVLGSVEPTDEEADWPETTESEVELANLLREKSEQQLQQPAGPGVPGFWLTALKNVDLLSQMIRDQDEPILRHLTDIKVITFSGEQSGFVLEFHFSPNEYFSNSMLTKHYYLRMVPDPEHPWDYEGPEIVRCSGCEILWKAGKNAKMPRLKWCAKCRSTGAAGRSELSRRLSRLIRSSTSSIRQRRDEEIEDLLQSDFEIGHFLRERVIPRAVLYFTGEGLEDEDYESEDDEGEDGDEDDMEEDEDERVIGQNPWSAYPAELINNNQQF